MTVKTMAEHVKYHAKQALDVQDACNPRGVLGAWHRALCDLYEDPTAARAINVLYMGKMASLLHMDAQSIGDATAHEPTMTFSMAYAWAKRQGEG